MNPQDMPVHLARAAEDGDPLAPLLSTPFVPAAATLGLPGVVIGELLALADHDRQPLVRHAGGGPDALLARTTVDLQGAQIGAQVLLVFEQGNANRPIITGVLREPVGGSSAPSPTVQVATDGQRLTVSARDQLVLRCGLASITLTRAGKVLIEGAYVTSQSTGVNRVKGGSVQLN